MRHWPFLHPAGEVRARNIKMCEMRKTCDECWHEGRSVTGVEDRWVIIALTNVQNPAQPSPINHTIYRSQLLTLFNSIVSRCRRTLRGKGHSAAGWGIGGSVWLQTAGSKVRSFGQWAAATCAVPPVSLPVSTPLRIVNRCWSGFPCKWRYINVATFNLLKFYWCWVIGYWAYSQVLDSTVIGGYFLLFWHPIQ